MHAKRQSTRFTAATLGALIWTMLILGLYYWVHKPITPPLARAAGGALLDMAVAAVFALAAGGLGRRLLLERRRCAYWRGRFGWLFGRAAGFGAGRFCCGFNRIGTGYFCFRLLAIIFFAHKHVPPCGSVMVAAHVATIA